MPTGKNVIASSMILTLDIPDEFSGQLAAKMGNPARTALEAFAAEAYQLNALSLEQVRTFLGLESRWQAQELLSRRGAWPGLSADEVLKDAKTAAAFTVSR